MVGVVGFEPTRLSHLLPKQNQYQAMDYTPMKDNPSPLSVSSENNTEINQCAASHLEMMEVHASLLTLFTCTKDGCVRTFVDSYPVSIFQHFDVIYALKFG